jgi:hypothetical protein
MYTRRISKWSIRKSNTAKGKGILITEIGEPVTGGQDEGRRPKNNQRIKRHVVSRHPQSEKHLAKNDLSADIPELPGAG